MGMYIDPSGPQRSEPSSSSRRIEAVRATPIAVPLQAAVRFATREVQVREYLLVEVIDGDGIAGIGFTYVGTNASRAAATIVETSLAPLLLGHAPAPEWLWDAMYRETILLGRRGIAMRAMSAVDIALWDLLGKRANLPLSVLLGGGADVVPAYASGGYYRPGDPIENVVRELTGHLERGFKAFKIKVGGAEPDVDTARVRAARETVGPQHRLALDANNAWHTPREALRFIEAVASFDPWWVEEPLEPDDIEGHAEVTRRSSVTIATGEIHAGRWEFAQLIDARSADILQADAGVCGGITEWLKIAHEAQAHGIPLAPHWNANLHVHLAAAVSNCIAVEYFVPEMDVYNFELVLQEPLRVRDGGLVVPQRPGLGLVLDRGAVARFAL